MRYLLLILVLAVALVVIIAGPRGGLTRRRPIEIFPDMNRQAKLLPQKPDGLFPDGRASQLPVPGTVARQSPYQNWPVYTGRVSGLTNFVATGPLPLTRALLERGRQRFEITCSPCHGSQADGNGITRKFGMNIVANLHDKRIVEMADGEMFDTVTYGKGLMGGYSGEMVAEDRWAVIAYLRVLQRAQLGTLDDVPAADQAALKK
jgi:mono/diheme cytochrome c family protein